MKSAFRIVGIAIMIPIVIVEAIIKFVWAILFSAVVRPWFRDKNSYLFVRLEGFAYNYSVRDEDNYPISSGIVNLWT